MLSEVIYSTLVYVMFSITEWIVHKYIMHGDKDKSSFARDHIVHHIHTNRILYLSVAVYRNCFNMHGGNISQQNGNR